MSDQIAPESLLSHSDFIRRLAWRLLRDEHQVEDVVQDTFVAAIERPPPDESGVRSWLGVVTRNLALKKRRSDTRRRKREETVAARTVRVPTAQTILEREAVRQRVVTAVLELDEPYRSVVLLRFFESLPPRDIARSLDVPVETVRTRLKRACAQLRERLHAEDGENRGAWVAMLLPLARGAPFQGLEGLPETAGPATTGAATMSSTATGLGVMKLLLGAALVAVAGGGIWWMAQPADDGGAAAPPVVAEEPAAPDEDEPERERVRPQSLDGAASDTESDEGDALPAGMVAGVLVDESGAPFANKYVWIAGEDDVVGEGERDREPWHGREAETDEEGRFRVELDVPRRVRVSAGRSPEVQPLEREAKWITPPADDLRVVARRMPVGTLTVRVDDPAAGESLAGFICRVDVRGDDLHIRAEDEVATQVLRMQAGESTLSVTVTLVEPALSVAPSQEIALLPGKQSLITFEMPDRAEISGRVVDANGNAVTEACVFFGDQFRARRNWSRNVHPEDAPDAVYTDADGRFTVRGDSTQVTAFHASHGVVTAAIDDAGTLTLPAPGKITGRVVDLEGNVLAGKRLHLDRRDKWSVETDAQGRFTFETALGGVRWISLPKPMRHLVGVRVDAGQTADVDISGWLAETNIQLTSNGAPTNLGFGGVVLGLDRVFTLHEFEYDEGRTRIGRILPGRYLFLSRSGHMATVNVNGPDVTADVGTATLTVQAEPGTRIYVIPAGSPEQVRLFAPHNAREIPESGELSWGPLRAGSYAIGVPRRGIQKTVEVTDAGTAATLE